jgi:thiamine-monophosphate kinase
MLDISDGLAKDAGRIAKASDVAIRLNARDLNGFEAMVEEPARAIGASALDWVLFGGEDHGLLATFPAEARIPREFKPIGVVLAADENQPSRVLLDDAPIAEKGWDSILGN